MKTEVSEAGLDWEQLVSNALVSLYQPASVKGEDFYKVVVRLFGLGPREARLLLESHGFDPFVKVLRSFKANPYPEEDEY